MSDQEKKSEDRVNLMAEIDGDRVEIIHRHGAAAEIDEPQKVSIEGSIEAPAEYFNQREPKDMIDVNTAHLEVQQERGIIILECNPHSPLGTKVTGRMTMNPLLSKMNINDYGQSKFSESDFILMLKETRSLFTDQSLNLELIDKVQNLDYRVTREIEKRDDERGSRKEVFNQICEDTLPEGFNLSTNIFVASKDELTEHEFYVEIKYHYSSGLFFWLESPDFHELYEKTLADMVGSEIIKFDDKLPVIYR